MSPEVAEAIRIADKHLPGAPAEQRMALAKEIVVAICKQGDLVALHAIKVATEVKQH